MSAQAAKPADACKVYAELLDVYGEKIAPAAEGPRRQGPRRCQAQLRKCAPTANARRSTPPSGEPVVDAAPPTGRALRADCASCQPLRRRAARRRRFGRAGQPRLAAARPRRLSRPDRGGDGRSRPARPKRQPRRRCRRALRARSASRTRSLRPRPMRTSAQAGIQAAARALRYGAARALVRRAQRCDLDRHRASCRRPGRDPADAAGARRGRRRARGIRPARPLEARIAIVRPLLGWRRGELAAIVAAAGLDRGRRSVQPRSPLRSHRARAACSPSADWLDARRGSPRAADLAEADAALDWTADALYDERVRRRRGSVVRSTPPACRAELRRRLLSRGDRAVSTARDGAPSRPASSTRLLARLRAASSATLGGVLARPGPPWRFAPAAPRASGAAGKSWPAARPLHCH